MSLTLLGGLFVLGTLLHNLEEAIGLPAWSRTAGRLYPPVGSVEFAFAAVVVSLLLVALAVAAWMGGPRSLPAYLFAGYVASMALNALVPHLAVSVITRRLMPGTATGLLLNLPLGIAFVWRALDEDVVAGPTLVGATVLMALLLVASIRPLFAIGRRVQGARSGRHAG